MTKSNAILSKFSLGLEHFEEKVKPLFVYVALCLYAGSLVLLALKVNPAHDLQGFLVKALGNLAIPFGVILLQECLELLSTISQNRFDATCMQFEIVALVILRSFFKGFGKLNEAVVAGVFDYTVQKALVKVIALLLITVLIMTFKRLSRRAGIHRLRRSRKSMDMWQQAVTVFLCLGVLFHMAWFQHSFKIMSFIGLVFTGMIVIDAVFFLWSILKSHEFDSLMFDGGLVLSLILSRFPLFAPNLLAYVLAVVGVAYATISLRLFVNPVELEFLGHPQEDDVARLDACIMNKDEDLVAFSEDATTFMKQYKVPEKASHRILIVCDELLNNVISYAYEEEGKNDIQVSLALSGDRLTVTVIDDGKAYNPFSHNLIDTQASMETRAIGGLGIHLVRNVMDRISYRREAGTNVVTVLKLLTTDSDRTT